jgi:molybdopterin-containing oxidoreductase family membrane subunit
VFDTVTPYAPTAIEILITLGVYAVGLLVLSLMWKIATGAKREAGTFDLDKPGA